jgi:tRNA dimethylallyltransferase
MRHVVVLGPTGSGKSALAMAVAERDAAFEIVSVDAMCVYRRMDLGTAKPSLEERERVPHHLVDVVDPSEDYSLTRFQADCAAALRDIEARGKRALLVGGTGLYVRAAVDGLDVPPRYPDVVADLETEPDTAVLYARLEALDPQAATKMQPNNRRRVVRALEVCIGSGQPFSSYGPGLDAYPPTPFRLIGLWPTREALGRRLEARFTRMMDAGFLDEVRALAAGPVSRTARQALGYRQLLTHVEEGRPLADCVAEAVAITKQFARRQRVWFRRDPRIAWFDAQSDLTLLAGRQNW